MKRDLEYIAETLADFGTELFQIDFNVPAEPREDASAEDWKQYGLDVADRLADAEKVVMKISEKLQE